jgi:hypothetical protein
MILACSVIGSTRDFDSLSLGSSPSEPIFFPHAFSGGTIPA